LVYKIISSYRKLFKIRASELCELSIAFYADARAAIRQRSGRAPSLSHLSANDGFRFSIFSRQRQARTSSWIKILFTLERFVSKLKHCSAIEDSSLKAHRDFRRLNSLPESQQVYASHLNFSKRRCFTDTSLQIGVRLEIRIMLILSIFIDRIDFTDTGEILLAQHLTCESNLQISYFILQNHFRKISCKAHCTTSKNSSSLQNTVLVNLRTFH